MAAVYLPEGFGIIRHRFLLDGDPESMYVSYAVKLTDGPFTADAVAQGTHEAWADLWGARGSDKYVLKETTSEINAGDPDPLVGAYVHDDPGVHSSTLIPQNSSWLVHKSTGFGGRRNKGRMYVPGVFESSVNDIGQVDGTAISDWNGSLATFRTAILAVAGVSALSLLHTPSDDDPTPTGTDVTALTMDSVIATQRRRLRR
jgi:hypothetical protein